MIRLLTIAKNTVKETIRQPVFFIIILTSLLLIMLAPSISMYTLDEDDKLLRELSLSTLFLSGLFIAVFSASTAINEEIETGTITTVLSKPIPRPIFILGKFLGLSVAVLIAHYLLSVAMLMAVRHGALEAASDTHDWPVIIAAAVILLATFFISALMNYFYDWNYMAASVSFGVLFSTAGMIFLGLITKEWKLDPSNNGFHLFDIYASILLLFGTLILVALAVFLSTRLNVVLTLTFCVGIFLLGLISDWLFARHADQSFWAKLGMILAPNLQIFWVSDAIYEIKTVPFKMLTMGLSYSVFYIAGILSLAVAFFQKRQIG